MVVAAASFLSSSSSSSFRSCSVSEVIGKSKMMASAGDGTMARSSSSRP